MKISKLIKVVLASSDGDATFHFRAPKLNELMKESEALKGIADTLERTKKELEFNFARLEKIEGLEDDDGNSIDVSAISSLDLPINTLIAIQSGYLQAAISSIRPKEPAPEKKDDSKE